MKALTHEVVLASENVMKFKTNENGFITIEYWIGEQLAASEDLSRVKLGELQQKLNAVAMTAAIG